MIKQSILDQAYSYEAYKKYSQELFDAGKTSGPNQSEMMVQFTGLNLRRMKRLDKTTRLLPEALAAMEQISRPQSWLIITESWCGDAAQILPVIQAMADAQSLVKTYYIFRDEHLDIMDQYLTNGSRSIPVLAMLDADSLEELGRWAPRPKEAQELVMAYKANPNTSYEDFNAELQSWYNRDKTRSIQLEISEKIRQQT